MKIDVQGSAFFLLIDASDRVHLPKVSNQKKLVNSLDPRRLLFESIAPYSQPSNRRLVLFNQSVRRNCLKSLPF